MGICDITHILADSAVGATRGVERHPRFWRGWETGVPGMGTHMLVSN